MQTKQKALMNLSLDMVGSGIHLVFMLGCFAKKPQKDLSLGCSQKQAETELLDYEMKLYP